MASVIAEWRGPQTSIVRPLYPSSSDSERRFYHVGGKDLEKLDVLKDIFNRILTPLYGSQDKAIRQIAEGTDRTCFLLYEGGAAVGALAFKTILTNEFKEYGITDSIEVKSLFVDNSNRNAGRGLGSNLIDKLKIEVEKLGLPHKGIHVTVSETKEESLIFFRKKGFEIAHAWKDRYIKGVTEYLLSCPAKIQEAGKTIHDLTQKFDGLLQRDAGYSEREQIPELVHIIHNAHLDDIHAFKKLSDGTFISGSKDNCLYKWNQKGELVSIVDEVEPTNQDERNWITAVEVLNDEYWVSGERNGRVSLWKTNGEYVRDIQLKLPKWGHHVSHEYNTRRVNCFATGLNKGKPSLFVGFPTMFDEFNFIENRTDSSNQVHKNDWVYCIHPLNKDSILTVTGCTVDLWKKTQHYWQFGENLVPEDKRVRTKVGNKWKYQRAFISSLIPLKASESSFGLALFDGSVKVLDINEKKITRSWKEHQARVWSIENITPQIFASSGEDRTIKFWDQRQNKSIHTIPDHVGQVTSMLCLNDNILIAGTCPQESMKLKKGAEIRFYDIRK